MSEEMKQEQTPKLRALKGKWRSFGTRHTSAIKKANPDMKIEQVGISPMAARIVGMVQGR